MGIERVKITFYRIGKSGYYRSRSTTPEFCSIANLLDDFIEWTHQEGMTLADTCPYGLEESESFMRCFSYDAVKSGNEYLLCNWNELPSNDGHIPSIVLTEPVGDAPVHFTELPENGTPGFATYFWFIPERGVFATIKFSNVLNGKRQMEKVLRSFLGKFAHYAVYGDTGDSSEEETVLGYRRDHESEPENLTPCFSSSAYVNPGEITEIKRRRTDITKMIRKNKLKYGVRKDRALWQKIIDSFGVREVEELDSAVKIRYEVPYSPSITELNEIIERWEASERNGFEDVGFRFKGSQQIAWLSSSLAKDEIDIRIERRDGEIVDLNRLLEELQSRRREITRVLR